jgi:hypothetical protein
MVDKIDPRLERLRAVAAASSIRSPLARWLTAHHDEFEQLLRDYRPRWEALVEQFADEGLLRLPVEFSSDDPNLRAVTRRKVVKATMRTWERVKAHMSQKTARAPSQKSEPRSDAEPTRAPIVSEPDYPITEQPRTSLRQQLAARMKPVTIPKP